MPIVEKSNAIKHLRLLDERVSKLRKVLEGRKPNDGLWDLYALNSNDFERDFTEIDQTTLTYSIGELDFLIKELKK